MDTDPFVRLARKLRFYGGPNPQFGIKTLPPAPGMTAGLFAFALIGEPGEGESAQLQDSIETLKGERDEARKARPERTGIRLREGSKGKIVRPKIRNQGIGIDIDKSEADIEDPDIE